MAKRLKTVVDARQPDKIKKEGLATLIAEWSNIEGLDADDNEKLTMKLTPEIILKIFRELVMKMLALWDLVQLGLDLIG